MAERERAPTAAAGADTGVEAVDTGVEAVPAAVFWPLTLAGLAVLGFGVWGMWVNQGTGLLDVRLRPLLTWMIAAVVLHDLVLAPATLAAGRGLRWVRPRVLRAPLQVALAGTVLVTLLAYPLLRGYGARAGDPSRLPLDYSTGYAALLAVLWTSCAAWAWWRRRAAAAPPSDARTKG